HTIASIHHMADGRAFEFQRLHGMGTDLYSEVVGADKWDVPCRVYAPVGSHEDLLPYLVRRLLENGANSSFVNRISDERIPIRDLIADPVESVRDFGAAHGGRYEHPRIPLPIDLYGALRKNCMGASLANEDELKALAESINAPHAPWTAAPLVPGANTSEPERDVTNPADRRVVVGRSCNADAATIERALANAVAAREGWDTLPSASRAVILERAADLLEQRRGEFIALCVREAGKTIPAAISEVREAADMCRYYAAMARKLFGQPEELPGPTGESNQLFLRGRGVFVCISPWNFPLAI